MNCRPITFTAPNVRAMRKGRKTQTRRLRGLEMLNATEDEASPDDWDVAHTDEDGWLAWMVEYPEEGSVPLSCPYGIPGDLLWVKEPLFCDHVGRPTYTATDDNCDSPGTWKWKRKGLPAMFMPRIYSRSTLEVLDVRVERLQDIAPEDCSCEGIVGTSLASPVRGQPYEEYRNGDGLVYPEPQLAFRALWDTINAKPEHRWDTNLWVWATTFRLKEDT